MVRAAKKTAKPAKASAPVPPDPLRRIRVGTLAAVNPGTPDYLRRLLPHGFESFALTVWQRLDGVKLADLAPRVRDALAGSGAVVSALSVFGNPLMNRPVDKLTRQAWEQAIDHAAAFGCDLVTGFTGRVVGQPVPESIPQFKKVFRDLALRAKDRGVRIAFENCDMGGTWETGDWNVALYPQAWELLFDALPLDNLGLEWEPCHQMVKLIDPIPQLRKWVGKVFHVHGKDATIAWDVVREYGVGGGKPYVWHRTPGFGDTNWTDIVTILRQAGWTGSIDIEGWHDPVYKGELEIQGQVHGLNYLKSCRGGAEYLPPA